MLITIHKTLQERMVEDFVEEYKEQEILLKRAPNSPHGIRAKERMIVIREGIKDLKLAMSRPHINDHNYLERDYNQYELATINHLPHNLNGI